MVDYSRDHVLIHTRKVGDEEDDVPFSHFCKETIHVAPAVLCFNVRQPIVESKLRLNSTSYEVALVALAFSILGSYLFAALNSL